MKYSRVFRSTKLFLGILAILASFWAANAQTAVPAFPGAEGRGAGALGGRGGKILEVTNLNDSGPGSLRAACLTAGPRIVVFRVAGTIELTSRINIDQPYLTIAGQTAPGDGIVLKAGSTGGQMLFVLTHDVVIRYLRIRVGSIGGPGQGQVNIQINAGCYNVVVDHCSFAWTLDENYDITRNIPDTADEATYPKISNITLQRSILAEGLLPHSTGARVGGEFAKDGWKGVYDLSFHHNLFVANNARNPSVGTTGAQIINNVVYQWGSELGATTAGAVVDWIGNYFVPGNLSALNNMLVHNAFDKYDRSIVYPLPSLYMSGNIMLPGTMDWDLYTVHYANTPVPDNYKRSSPLAPGTFPITVQTAAQAYQSVIADVGANARLDENGNLVANIDEVDQRLLGNVRNRTDYPKFLTSEAEVGGYPPVASGTPYADSDHDGMADKWETAKGLNPSANDSAAYSLDSRYTNIEVFLNGPAAPTGNTAPPAPSNLRITSQ